MTYFIKLDPTRPPDTEECITTFSGWADTDALRHLLGDRFTAARTIVQDLVMLYPVGGGGAVNRAASDLLKSDKRTVRGVAYMAIRGPNGGVRGMDFNRASHWCCALKGW